MEATSTFDLKGFLNDPKVQADKASAMQFLQSKGIVDSQGQPVQGKSNVAPAVSPTLVTKSSSLFSANPNDSTIGGIAKLLGNIPSSAFNFAKGAVNALNPVNVVKNISHIPDEFSHLVQESGGVGPALGATAKEIIPSAYGALVPKAAQQVISGDFGGARETLTNDPVGQILPFLLVAKGAAEKAGAGPQFDNAISKIASPVTKTAEVGADTIKNSTGASTKFAVAQATGLKPETLTKVISDPEAFSKEAQATVSRGAIADEIKATLGEKKSALSETGKAYDPIRQSQTPIGVDNNWLTKTIQDTTGLNLVDGKFETSASASIRDAKDVRAIQNLYDTHNPVFERGAATTNEFLNLRQDLTKLSKFDREVTRSAPLENLSSIIRGKLNTAYRGKIPGLGDITDASGNVVTPGLDTQFGSQIEELNRLKKGILDKNGNLTDTGINRIANATGKGKDLLLAKLEEINPGITEKIKTLKAVEDIQNAGGQKVGTYARAGGLITGVVTANPYLILGSILSIPDIAVPILRGIGMAEPKIASTLRMLNIPLKVTNKIPTLIQNQLQK